MDADIKAFFDTVNHEKLIDAVAERISDGRVLRLIRAFLEVDIAEQGQGLAKNVIGTPQGGVISPTGCSSLNIHRTTKYTRKSRTEYPIIVELLHNYLKTF
jgi:retron-type reverse transcriptase